MIDQYLPFNDFRASAKQILSYLYSRYKLDLWMVTRTVGDDWIVLETEDHGYNVKNGDVFRWTDSFCSRMVKGLGPCIAPKSNSIPEYVDAPIGRQVPIGAYIGVPLTNRDGTLFGTLCAIDPLPQKDELTESLPEIELLSRLLTTILDHELRTLVEARRAELAEEKAEVDSLTGLLNRRGWERILSHEESRCGRYGSPAAIVSIDLDGFKEINDTQGHTKGDDMLIQAGKALRAAARCEDVVARLGGDEFAVLMVNADRFSMELGVQRFETMLAKVGISGSVGIAYRAPNKSLLDAYKEADEAMYRRKRERKGRGDCRTPLLSMPPDDLLEAASSLPISIS